MPMKGNMMAVLGMALAMGGDMPFIIDDERKRGKGEVMPKPQVMKLSGLKYIGEVPKGCSVVKATIQTRIPDYHVEVEVEILAATNKAFNQKLAKKEREVLGYIARTPVSELLKDERFKLTQVEKVELSSPEG